MKKLNTYLDLCTEYYDLDKPLPPKEDFDFYLEYVKNAKGPVLEPMCGTGRFLVPLLEAGYDIRGFDASTSMLQKLQQKISSEKFDSNIWQGFIQDLTRKDKVNLVFIPNGSFGLITDLEEIKESLKKIYECLADDGLFVFEFETLNAVPKQLNAWHGDIKEMHDGKFIIASFLNLPLKNSIVTGLVRYELVEESRVVQAEVEKYKIRLYDSEELKNLLTNVGFRQIKFIKAFDHDREPDEQDEVFVCECQK